MKIDFKTEFNFPFFKYIAKLTVLFMPNMIEITLNQKYTGHGGYGHEYYKKAKVMKLGDDA